MMILDRHLSAIIDQQAQCLVMTDEPSHDVRFMMITTTF